MHIGILVCGHTPEELRAPLGTYHTMYPAMLEGYGFTFEAWDVVDMDFPNSIRAADGWLVTGSRHGAYEDHPFIPPLEQFIQAAFMAAIPLVGVCFGHQIIAQALGGRVEKSTKGWGVGRQIYRFGNQDIPVNVWHQDQVVEAPALAETVARNPFCDHAALVYGDRAFTVQSHPEFGDAMIQGLINLRGVGVVPDQRLAYAQSQMGQPSGNAEIAAQIADFFKLERKREEIAQ